MIKLFNLGYFLGIIISLATFFGLYFLLKNKSDKSKKIILFCVLLFALILHFLKAFFPPYSTNISRLYTDSWFINICGANIGLFPFFFLSKNKYVKDYMFYLGLLGGGIAILYPLEAMDRPISETLDVIRFYIHHTILWVVPLLMVILKLHTLSYRRLLAVPITFSCVMGFIVLNQVLQSELGYIVLRSDEFFEVKYKNSSMIWGPDDEIGKFLSQFCPNIFKVVPVGSYKGQIKYWPILWLLVPMYILLVPISFGLCVAVNHKNVINDIKSDIDNIKDKKDKITLKIKNGF